MTKLTETQTIILSAEAQRPENIVLPLPKGMAGAAAKMAGAQRPWCHVWGAGQEARACRDLDAGRAGAGVSD